MYHDLSNPIVFESYHISLTILKKSALVHECSTFKHVSISCGKNSHHEIEQQYVKNKEMENHSYGIYIFTISYSLITVPSKHVVILSSKTKIKGLICIWIDILVLSWEHLRSKKDIYKHDNIERHDIPKHCKQCKHHFRYTWDHQEKYKISRKW